MNTYDLNKPANWRISHQGRIISALPPGEAHPTIYLPVLLDSPVLLIACSSDNAKPNWFLGCRVEPFLNLPNAPIAIIGTSRAIGVNRPGQLVHFPKYHPQYQLRVSVPRWISDLSLTVWEYVGSVDYPLTDTLERVERKIDTLL